MEMGVIPGSANVVQHLVPVIEDLCKQSELPKHGTPRFILITYEFDTKGNIVECDGLSEVASTK